MYHECRHIKSNGLRCESPALSGTPFCYFHTRLHRLTSAPKPNAEEPLKLPLIESPHDIQLALAQVLTELGSSRLDPRRASLFLYGLQIASQNIDHSTFVYEPDILRTVTRSRNGEELAPVLRVCETPEDCVTCRKKETCKDREEE